MNWNANDNKYILKRLIVYILIAFAMFIIGTLKANAQVLTDGMFDWDPDFSTTGPVQVQNGAWTNTIRFDSSQHTQKYLFISAGSGIATFSFVYWGNTQNTSYIKSVSLVRYDGYQFNCDIGNQIQWYDNNTARYIVSAKCPVQIPNGQSLKGVKIDRYGNNGDLQIRFGYYMTMVQDESDANSIISGQQAAAQQQIANDNINTQAIIEATNNASQQQHQDMQQINDSINNDNITTSDADDLVNNEAFIDSTGLESVIQLPLNMVNSLSNTCQPISITIPFINYTGTIPCMSTIYSQHFGSLYTLLKVVINGFFVYRLLLKVYELVHSAKQPDEDKLEVIDL